MVLDWRHNLAAQFLLVMAFVALRPTVDEITEHRSSRTPHSTIAKKARGASKDHAYYPIGNARVTSTYTMNRTQDEIQIIYPARDYSSPNGYRMMGGAPSKLAVSAVERELEKYPDSLLMKLGLEWVVLLRDYQDPKGAGLVSSGHQKRHAALLNTQGLDTRAVASHLHHEIWEMITEKYTLPKKWPRARWHANYRASRAIITTGDSCFISEFAGSHPENDRAEMFRVAIAYPEVLESRMSEDACLREKFNLLRAQVRKIDPRLAELIGASR